MTCRLKVDGAKTGCFLASIANHPVYQACITSLDKTYQIALTSEDKWWMRSSDRFLCERVTSYLTGAVLEEIVMGTLTSAELDQNNYPLEQFVDIVCDNSWKTNGIHDVFAHVGFNKFAEKVHEYKRIELIEIINNTKIQLKALVAQQAESDMANISRIEYL